MLRPTQTRISRRTSIQRRGVVDRGEARVRGRKAAVCSGVIAQEVERVLPHVVHNHEDGYKSVNHNALIGYLIEEVKALRAEVEALRDATQLWDDHGLDDYARNLGSTSVCALCLWCGTDWPITGSVTLIATSTESPAVRLCPDPQPPVGSGGSVTDRNATGTTYLALPASFASPVWPLPAALWTSSTWRRRRRWRWWRRRVWLRQKRDGRWRWRRWRPH